jgi:hypothetical protein
MQTKVGRFTKEQALDKLLQKTRGNTAVCTKIWNFLVPKFDTDGTLFWSARLEAEVDKSKKHSLKQTERINKRWAKESGNTAVLPVYRNGISISIEDKIKESFDPIYLEQEKMKWPQLDFKFQFDAFCTKVRGSPEVYAKHNSLRLAFQKQLREAKQAPQKKKDYKY